MDSLVRARGYIKAKLTRFANHVNELELNNEHTTKQMTQLQKRLDVAIPLLEEYEQINSQIVIDASTGKECDSDDPLEFENTYFSAIACAEDILKVFNDSIEKENRSGSLNSSSHSCIFGNTRKLPSFNLPKISIPLFSGQPNNWLEYKSIFSSLIHENPDLSEIQKLHYLKGSLTGTAADVIKSLEFTASNYQIAYNTLISRYDQPKLLIRNHLKSILNLESLSKESATSLRNVSDSLFKHVTALRSLAKSEELFETFIIHVVAAKLDQSTTRQWETLRNNSKTDLPTLEEFKSFLNKQANLIDSLETKTTKVIPLNTKVQSKSFVVNNPTCLLCKKGHYLSKCEKFLAMSPAERSVKAEELKVCFNCLVRGHMKPQCRNRYTCRTCKAKHHTLLHVDSSIVKAEAQSAPSTTGNQALVEPVPSVSAFCSNSYKVLLPTASCKILDYHGNFHSIRVLLDSGSQSNFIRSDLCEKLQLSTKKVNISVAGLSGALSNIHLSCDVQINAHHSSYKIKLSCLILNKITGTMPSFRVDSSSLKIPDNIHLSDPTFNQPGQIDLLIGSPAFFELLCVGQVRLGPNLPMLQKTRFGWVISGPVNIDLATNVQCYLSTSNEVEEQLAKFWEIDNYPIDRIFSSEEEACESSFVKNTRQDPNGRFVVTLPLKESAEVLGDSFGIAKRRLLSLERHLQTNSDLSNKYSMFMKEYLEMGHMSLSSLVENQISYYLPHHGVFKEDSLTTKLRVVFNGSQATSSGHSLNSIQMVGPTIQQDLFSILIRFRKYRYGISADIEKMYRQVHVEPRQRPLQRILWRFSQSDFIESYDLNTVTYGTASASFLAIRCLFQLGINCETSQPEISRIIKQDFYVDDLLTGSDNLKDAREICSKLDDVLRSGCFKLRKWISNDVRILSNIPKSDLHPGVLNLSSHEHTHTLGLIWSVSNDEFTYSISKTISSSTDKITKRIILSDISKIFDPLGLLTPCIIRAKILLQQLWLYKLSWDDPVPNHIQSSWIKFRHELTDLNTIKVPRHVLCQNPIDIQLHGFCDASIQGYGACIYLRCVDVEGKVQSRLLCSKSRVAPLKPLTIPKLELCGALLLARLSNQVIKALDLQISNIFLWTDSTIVLGWLKTSPNLLKTFVGNRVADIQRLNSDAMWVHVPTKSNPADLLSRGTTIQALQNSTLWWNAPSWLIEDQSSWPKASFLNTELPELKGQSQCLTSIQPPFSFTDYSNLNRLERVIAYCLRFVKNSSSKIENRLVGPLTPKEIQGSQLFLVKIAQQESFANEKKQLLEKKSLKSSSRLLSFNPFLDANGVIRVGGRLINSQFPFDKKHPILLSGKHLLSKLIVEREHVRLLHASSQQLLYSLRSKFWITSGRNLTKQVVHRCVRCFRFTSKLTQPIMGNLPSARLTPSHPFHVTGIDFAGPLMVKDHKRRGSKVSKVYICLYVCFTTKATHIELVSSLTTEAFLLSFRRFVARRGKPLHVYTDNGTNFVGANFELRELGELLKNDSKQICESSACEGVNWHFAPAHSPHFGGLWEAGIKSCKFHLKRVIGNTLLTFEEMLTFLTQVEATLNSRPLSPISDDPNDLQPLTPAHFLVGRPLTALPDPDVTEIKESRLSIFQRVQQLHQHLWSRWNKEYVTELQQRQKWQSNRSELKLGTLVIIREDNLPPLQWKLGRIVQLHPGNDGVNRVATILTNSGVVRRSFSKLCPLPNQ